MVEPWPLLSEVPSVETWGPAEKEGAEGHATRDSNSDTEVAGARPKNKKPWGQKKVFHEICNHTAAAYPQSARDQWAALKHFHETHTCSDSVPFVPFNMQGATRTWPISHGSPIDWKACWAKLAWRFPRAHHSATVATTDSTTVATTVATTAATPPQQRLTPNELLLANGIQGASDTNAARNAAVTD